MPVSVYWYGNVYRSHVGPYSLVRAADTLFSGVPLAHLHIRTGGNPRPQYQAHLPTLPDPP